MRLERHFWTRLGSGLVLLGLAAGAGCNFPTPALRVEAALTETFAVVGTAVVETQSAALEMLTAGTPTPPTETETPPPLPATESPTLTATIAHQSRPGEPAFRTSWMVDSNSAVNAQARRVTRGEYYQINWLERPFNAETLSVYYADLDIVQASLGRRDGWVYVTIELAGQREGGLQGAYGVELDLNVDGRGDWLVLAGQPGAEWSTERVRVWRDLNMDVGDNTPVQSDPPQGGDGYETLVFDSGWGEDADLAWARLDANNRNSAQIAFKEAMIQGDTGFLWGAWADQGLVNPAWFDYVDHFSYDEAGSPLVEAPQYPLKAVFEVDNTCRWAAGFTPSGDELGLCPLPAAPTPTGQATATVSSAGVIAGMVFKDGDGDLVYDAGEEGISGAEVRLRMGECSSPGRDAEIKVTSGLGEYQFSGLDAGT